MDWLFAIIFFPLIIWFIMWGCATIDRKIKEND